MRQAAILIALLWVSTWLRVHDLGAQSIWTDEAVSLHGARLPADKALLFLLTDSVHPPLYYFVQRISFLFGSSEFALRWPAALFGVLSAAAVARLGREWFGGAVGLCAAGCLMILPIAVWYGREARMYTLLALLASGVMAEFVRFVNGRGRTWLFVAFSAALYLTHYYGLFAPPIQLAYLLLTFRHSHRCLRTWVLAQFIAGVPIVIWLGALYSLGAFFGIEWIHLPGLSDLALTLQNFMVGYGDEAWRWAATVVGGLTLAVGLFQAMARVGGFRDGPPHFQQAALLTGLWLFLPALVAFGISLRRPVYVDRFLFVSLPALALALGIGVVGLLRWRWWAGMAVAVILGVGMGAGAMALLVNPAYAKEDWRGLAETIEAQKNAGDVILLRYEYYALPFEYYYHDAPKALAADDEAWRPGLPAGRLWLVYRGRLEDTHRFVESTPVDFARDEKNAEMREWLEMAEPYQIERRDLVGLTLVLFDFSTRRP